MSYFEPERIKSSGKNKYRITIYKSIKGETINKYYLIKADSEQLAISKSKSLLDSNKYKIDKMF